MLTIFSEFAGIPLKEGDGMCHEAARVGEALDTSLLSLLDDVEAAFDGYLSTVRGK